jgi:hypothetical protein
VQQAAQWDDTPTYVLDEAISYWNGGNVCLDDVKNGRWRSTQVDGISGCVDFSIYTVALCMAIKKGDPQYWEKNVQFRRFVVWYLRGAEATYREGSKYRELNQFPEQVKLLNSLKTSSDAAAMRAFIKEYLEGVWISS